MHCTPPAIAGRPYRGPPREVARDARALQEAAAMHPLPARRQRGCKERQIQPSTGPGPQAPGQAGGSDCVWEIEKEMGKQGRKGSKTYTCWMPSWRDGDTMRNVLQGEPVIWMPRLPGRWLGGEVHANLPTDVFMRTIH